MQKFPKSEFDYTAVYYHLKNHFTRHIQLDRNPDDLQTEEDNLITALTALDSRIIIPPSRLDDSIREIIRRNFGIVPIETDQGLSLSTASLENVPEEIYELTVLGQIEVALRDYVIDILRSHLINVEHFVDEQETEHNKFLEKTWDQYDEEMDDFEIGDYGYDYEGAIYPDEPNIEPFDREAAIAQREESLDELDLEDPAVILREVPVEKGLLGDMLHEHFGNCEFIDEIIRSLDFSDLNRSHITHFLRTKDFYFPDCDILERGFLLDILLDNIEQDFKSDRSEVDIHEHIATLFAAMCLNEPCKALLVRYNKAVEINDNLELQRLWYYLSAFCTIVEKALKQPPIDISALSILLESKYKEIEHKHGDSLNSLIKVFPADTVDTLFYPGLAEQQSSGHYPSCDAKLPLKPYFHTLELIARSTHEALVKVVGTQSGAEKTNVVSAMLCFVISTEPDKYFALTGRPSRQIFINVPVNFDYKSLILSVDEVFADEDDMERSIGADLEMGKRVAQRDIALPVDEVTSAKKMMQRLIATLALDETTRAAMLDQIETAEIGTPVTLSYLRSSDIVKSTEHRHSERVLIRALKEPRNVAEIVSGIKKSMAEQGITKPGTYTVHSGALLVYSYPNSICDECSISFLALQNSYETGFIAEFIDAVNTVYPDDAVQLRTRGFNPLTRIQDPNEFSMTVIAGSSKVFAKDAYAKLVASRPEAKYSCHAMPYTFSEEGINLQRRQASRHDRFYEYTAESTLHRDKEITVPYAGRMFMSGSKRSKLTSTKQRQLETEVAGRIAVFNR